MHREARTLWKIAFDAEMVSIEKAGTWVLQPLPKGKKPIGCRWVLKIKRTASGSIETRFV